MLIDFIACTKTRKNISSTACLLIEGTTGGIEEKKHELRETFCGVESHLPTEPTSQLFLHSWLPVL